MNRERYYKLRHHYRILSACECEGDIHPAINSECFQGFEIFEPRRIWRNYQYAGKTLVEVWNHAQELKKKYPATNCKEYLVREMKDQYTYH